jgi:hypothetical protein
MVQDKSCLSESRAGCIKPIAVNTPRMFRQAFFRKFFAMNGEVRSWPGISNRSKLSLMNFDKPSLRHVSFTATNNNLQVIQWHSLLLTPETEALSCFFPWKMRLKKRTIKSPFGRCLIVQFTYDLNIIPRAA